MRLPVFIIVRDRLGSLLSTIDSIQKQNRIMPIFTILDNGSTYKPLLDFLKTLEESGVRVIRNEGDWLAPLAELTKKVEEPFYAVTDPDIELGSKNTIIACIEMFGKVEAYCVGPGLRLTNLHDNPYTREQVELQKKQFEWKPRFSFNTASMGEIACIQAPIDTTFAIYRSGPSFQRLQRNSYRLLSPYEAKHLSWYLDPTHLPPDEEWYLAHANANIATIKKHLIEHKLLN